MNERTFNGNQYSIDLIEDSGFCVASARLNGNFKRPEYFACLGQEKLPSGLIDAVSSDRVTPELVDKFARQMASTVGSTAMEDRDFDPVGRIVALREGLLQPRTIIVDSGFARSSRTIGVA